MCVCVCVCVCCSAVYDYLSQSNGVGVHEGSLSIAGVGLLAVEAGIVSYMRASLKGYTSAASPALDGKLDVLKAPGLKLRVISDRVMLSEGCVVLCGEE